MATSNLGYGQFELGPYTIQFRPLRDNPLYTRYSIQVEGVEVGAQISCPDLDNCRSAYQDAEKEKKLTHDQINSFAAHCAEVARKAPPMTEVGPIRTRLKRSPSGQSNIGI